MNMKMLTTRELCEALEISESTVRRLLKQNRIPFIDIGTANRVQYRFDLEMVKQALSR